MSISLIIPYPPSVNNYWRHTRTGHYLSKRGRDYKTMIKQIIWFQGVREALKGRIQITILMYPPDNRIRDIDNVLKATLDALGDAGLYEDDSQIDKLIIIRKVPIKGGKLGISVDHLE